ncbi:translation initiation factor IF-2-like [Triticum dicoccoides]|uniref:translation initiation factor IF-2-like n=1 Tax=Triticum dicoccoides TaxID=85692 RepID=UPI001891C1BE|nr:translation initiation factor IF-2-like [Triticum dicoccoides]
MVAPDRLADADREGIRPPSPRSPRLPAPLPPLLLGSSSPPLARSAPSAAPRRRRRPEGSPSPWTQPPASPLRSELSDSSIADAFLLLLDEIGPGRPRSTAPTPSTTSERHRAVCLLYYDGGLPPLRPPAAPKPPAEPPCAPRWWILRA